MAQRRFSEPHVVGTVHLGDAEEDILCPLPTLLRAISFSPCCGAWLQGQEGRGSNHILLPVRFHLSGAILQIPLRTLLFCRCGH